MNVERSTGNNHWVVGDMGGAMARGDLERATTQLQAEPDPIEMLIIDDHPIVREGLAGVLERLETTTGLLATWAAQWQEEI